MAESDVQPGWAIHELMEVTSPFSATLSSFDAAECSRWPRSSTCYHSDQIWDFPLLIIYQHVYFIDGGQHLMVHDCLWCCAETFKLPSRCCGALSSNNEDERNSLLLTTGGVTHRCKSLMCLIFGGSSEVYKLSAEAHQSFVTSKVLWTLVKVHQRDSSSFCFLIVAESRPVLQCYIVLWESKDYHHFLPSGVRGIQLISCSLIGQALAWRFNHLEPRGSL